MVKNKFKTTCQRILLIHQGVSFITGLIILLFLICFSLILFRVIDTSMREKIHNYLTSREGKMVAGIYITLVIGALVITFSKQTKLIIKLTRLNLVRLIRQKKKK